MSFKYILYKDHCITNKLFSQVFFSKIERILKISYLNINSHCTIKNSSIEFNDKIEISCYIKLNRF